MVFHVVLPQKYIIERKENPLLPTDTPQNHSNIDETCFHFCTLKIVVLCYVICIKSSDNILECYLFNMKQQINTYLNF